MNVQIRYNADTFQETNALSGRTLPLVEEIPCQVTSGIETFSMALQWKDKNPQGDMVVAGCSAAQLKRLKKYLASDKDRMPFVGRWKRETQQKNPQTNAIEYESEVFLFQANDVAIALRMQTPADNLRVQFCAPDRTESFVGFWKSDLEYCFALATSPAVPKTPLDEEIAKLNALDDGDLKTLAPAVGVKWDAQASRTTMIEKLAKKRLAKRTEDAPPASPPEQPAAPVAPPAEAPKA